MKKFLYAVIIIIIFIAALYFVYNFYTKSLVKLPPPQNPPAFSVSYVYNFNLINIIEATSIDQEIKNDIENIKSAGFDGLKINFHFHEDNSTSNKIVKIAAKNGLYPIGQLVGHNEKPKDRAFTAKELANWENFVRLEVRKNKDLIYFWEVWNEPAMTDLNFRYGTPAEYLELLKRTQKIIKEENTLAKIIVTADYTDAEAELFTNEFLALGGDNYLDYLSFHPYNALDPGGRYNLTQTVAQEKELAKKYNKPLWITEIGYPDSDSSEARQAELALTLFQTADENKIPIVWFYWSDRRMSSVDGKSGWGLVRQDNTSKPSLEKIKAFISQSKKK